MGLVLTLAREGKKGDPWHPNECISLSNGVRIRLVQVMDTKRIRLLIDAPQDVKIEQGDADRHNPDRER